MNKLFDPQIAEAPQGEVQTQGLNIAALMAKGGVMNPTENPVATPIEIKTEPAKEDEHAATATTTSPNAESPTTKETPPPQTEEPKVAPASQKEVEQPKVPSWQEVLKQQQPDTVLKEYGFDDKAIRLLNELKGFEKIEFFSNLINQWKTNGDLTGYLKELSTDYSKMSAEDVMRHQLRKDYPKASDKQLDILFNTKIVQAYKLDSGDEEEMETGRLLLEAEADRHRDSLVASQQQYLFPKPPEPKAPEVDNSEAEAQARFEAYKSQVVDSSFAKDILSSGKITFGEGDEKFQYPVNYNELTDVLFDSDKWQETQFDIVKNPDGSIKSYAPKTEHQLLTAAVAKYGKSFLDAYAKHYKSLGGKAAIDPLENAKPPDNNVPVPTQSAPANAAEAMARQGTFNPGGYR